MNIKNRKSACYQHFSCFHDRVEVIDDYILCNSTWQELDISLCWTGRPKLCLCGNIMKPMKTNESNPFTYESKMITAQKPTKPSIYNINLIWWCEIILLLATVPILYHHNISNENVALLSSVVPKARAFRHDGDQNYYFFIIDRFELWSQNIIWKLYF